MNRRVNAYSFASSGVAIDPFKPAITHDPPNDGAILSLDKGLIIFPIRSAARELHSVAKTIVSNGLVHKHTVVVRVEAQEGKRQHFSQLGQRCHQNSLLAHQNARTPFNPRQYQSAPASA
jgi:hypothetical protein